jgi:hypothetical protein
MDNAYPVCFLYARKNPFKEQLRVINLARGKSRSFIRDIATTCLL